MTAAPAFAAGTGFTWSHYLLSWLEAPLVALGIDPVPMLDLVIFAAALIVFAYFAGKPFRKSDMLEPSGRVNLQHFSEIVVSGILNFLSGIIRHGIGARPILPLLGTYALFILVLNLVVLYRDSIRQQISSTSLLFLRL